MPPTEDRAPIVVHVRDTLIVAGTIHLRRLSWAASGAPRPVVVGAAMAASAGLAIFLHFTGVVPAAGATGLVSHGFVPRRRR